MAVIASFPQQALLGGIALYQWLLSPWVGHQCRFYPSCSHYAIDALKKYGAIQGVWLTTKRLLKCHPWHPGGDDKVP
ncbi:membrane protein insertion efficiency factor YidD [Candidatus Berkiella aquae]|uniref:Putative membrane protein insertion efficiency factor n=2 Tax=Candidatus Berkiella aquae TaxID=295108 RepID=A0A0Q9Z0P3_9GAMM|nr:membrane protein insertion efficiency factor YidD [Candidatus Berkiella aquae]MCS5712761.1 membrane protein insertion efficiency factor YidD [Candidatus Berkiella aquae]